MKWRRIFRKLTNKAIDAAFIVKSSAGLGRSIVVLHGASCSGKSTILRRLRRRYSGCTYLEMDVLQYWRKEADSNILGVAAKILTEAGVDSGNATMLVRCIKHAHRLPKRNTRHRSMVELLRIGISNDTVIATCGDLPPPDVDNGYYELMAECTNKTILHVLIAPDDAVLAKRIQSRGQTAFVKEYIASNNRRLRHRAFYDLVLTGNESAAEMLALIRTAIDERIPASPA